MIMFEKFAAGIAKLAVFLFPINCTIWLQHRGTLQEFDAVPFGIPILATLFVLGFVLVRSVTISSSRAASIASDDGAVTMHNPNLCVNCIGDAISASSLDLTDTGRCGVCGRVGDVWDLPRLEALKTAEKPIYADDGVTRINRPIRNSHI